VARQDMLAYFNQIFDGLCKLSADLDVDVKNGSALLDRLIKDVVSESELFDVERFIPLLQKYIRRTNPYIRQLLVGWITVLDSVPDINMVDWVSAARICAGYKHQVTVAHLQTARTFAQSEVVCVLNFRCTQSS
jgi:Vacuolar 14 Fab1-binding region